MADNLFREKSLQKLAGAETLDKYIKVVNPSIWVILASFIIIILMVFCWACFGYIYDVADYYVVSDGNEAYCYVNESDGPDVADKGVVEVNGTEYELGALPDEPVQITSEDNAYLCHMMGDISSEWVFKIPVKGSIPEGIYEGTVSIEAVKPISFITN